jgi:hypothetical protein
MPPNAAGFAPPALERKSLQQDAPDAVRYGVSFDNRVLNQFS